MLISEGTLNMRSFINIASNLNDEINKFNKELEIDLRKVTFADPSGITSIIILTRSVYNQYGIKTRIIMPESFEVARYLLNCGFTRDEGIITEFEHSSQPLKILLKYFTSGYYKNNKSSENYIPITEIESDTKIDSIVDDVTVWMINNNFLPEEVADLQVIIYELCQNVKYHSATKQNGLFFMQGYNPRNSRNKKKYCKISIADNGIGIYNSLLKNPDNRTLFYDECSAVRYALEKGATSIIEEANFRGNGLPRLLERAQKRRANLHVLSHGAVVSYLYNDPFGFPENKTIHISPIDSIEGTHIAFELISR